MKLDLSCTSNTATVLSDRPADRLHGQPVVSEVDLRDMRPHHPVLVVDRAECDLDADSSFTIAPEVLHIKVVDRNNTKKSSNGVVAHFHIRVAVKKGRPFVEVCALGCKGDRKKNSTGAWLPLLSK